jgi:hypothetical protein
MTTSFSDREIANLTSPEERELPHVLNELVGRKLRQVWFVMDHVQLGFDHAPSLRLNRMPHLQSPDGTRFEAGGVGYADPRRSERRRALSLGPALLVSEQTPLVHVER